MREFERTIALWAPDANRGGDGVAGRTLIALAFSKIVEAQDALRQADLPFALYMLDAVKVALAKQATSLIGSDADLAQSEREMIRWFKSMDDEEIDSPEAPPEVN